MWQQILICSGRKDFLKYVQENLEDLDYSLRLIKDLSDVRDLDAGYSPAAIVVDGKDSSWQKSYDLVKSRYDSVKILIVQPVGLPSPALDLGRDGEYLIRPTEDHFLVDFLLKAAPVQVPVEKLSLTHVTPVRTCDLVPGAKFEFDLFLYLPTNQKLLLYIRKQAPVNQDHLEKFKKHGVSDLYIRKTDEVLFENYCAGVLSKIHNDENLSETVKRQRLQKEVKDFFANFFTSPEMSVRESQDALAKCKSIVAKFLAQVSPNPEFHQQIMGFVGKNHTHLSHASNVAIFSSLFVMAMGLPDMEAVAVGALLHDIGFSKLPTNLFEIPLEDLTDAEKKIYQQHPEEGINLLLQRNMDLPPEVRDVILHHHENFDGSGFPRGLKGGAIHIGARLCQIADEFDYRTSFHAGWQTKTPLAALDELMHGSDTKQRLDLESLAEIRALFTGENKISVKDRLVIQEQRAKIENARSETMTNLMPETQSPETQSPETPPAAVISIKPEKTREVPDSSPEVPLDLKRARRRNRALRRG